MNWKKFLRPTKKRIILIVGFVILILFSRFIIRQVFSPKCIEFYADQYLRMDSSKPGCVYNEDEIINYLLENIEYPKAMDHVTKEWKSIITKEDVLNSVSINKTFFNFYVTFNSSKIQKELKWKEFYFCNGSFIPDSVSYPMDDFQIKQFPIEPNKDDVIDFMRFLYASGELRLTGFNQGGCVVDRVVLEDTASFTVIDELSWSVHNDVPPFNTNHYKKEYSIRIDKDSRNIEYIKTSPWQT